MRPQKLLQTIEMENTLIFWKSCSGFDPQTMPAGTSGCAMRSRGDLRSGIDWEGSIFRLSSRAALASA